jgi:hypothetical protein
LGESRSSTSREVQASNRLRCRPLGFVRRLRRYFGAVRLPTSVHHRRTSFDFPVRSAVLFSADRRGISRFPHNVLAYMHGVSDRARSGHTLRWRCTRCCLPLSSTASASRSTCRLRSGACISRLNTRPGRSPVNASTPPSRAAPHDSGPLWFAIPSTYETFIHNTLPVLTGARRIHETRPNEFCPFHRSLSCSGASWSPNQNL